MPHASSRLKPPIGTTCTGIAIPIYRIRNVTLTAAWKISLLREPVVALLSLGHCPVIPLRHARWQDLRTSFERHLLTRTLVAGLGDAQLSCWTHPQIQSSKMKDRHKVCAIWATHEGFTGTRHIVVAWSCRLFPHTKYAHVWNSTTTSWSHHVYLRRNER